MSVLAVRTYVVKPENGEEFVTKDRDTFRGDKSWRLFGQVFGAYFGVVELGESDSLAYQEKSESEIRPEGKLNDFVQLWNRSNVLAHLGPPTTSQLGIHRRRTNMYCFRNSIIGWNHDNRAS